LYKREFDLIALRAETMSIVFSEFRTEIGNDKS